MEKNLVKPTAHSLKKTYFFICIPAAAGFTALLLLKEFLATRFFVSEIHYAAAPLIFILSAVFAAALPIFLRTLFVKDIRECKSISTERFLKFERKLIITAMVAPYLALIAIAVEVPRFHLAGTMLLALYAVYYYYPSMKRIRFEMRLFRVRE